MKLNLLALVLFVSVIGLGAQSALANEIGPAGCGVGNLIFKKDTQIFAATINVVLMQTSGITSGTSGCKDSSDMAQMVMFVESNRVALSNDAARGQGETVDALSSILGCSDVGALGDALKANYGEIFEGHRDNSIAISKSIRQSVEKSPALARSCQRLS
jgi:hypothetical protein